MKLGLSFDLRLPHQDSDDRWAEHDPPATIEAIAAACRHWAGEVVLLGNAETMRRAPVRWRDCDLVLSIAEGMDGRCREAWVPTLLEQYGVPYVGAPPAALAMALDKWLTKRLAAGVGIPTPPAWLVETPKDADRVPLDGQPVIVKPRYGGSGMGIDEGAVVSDRRALRARAQWAMARYRQPMIVEEFVCGGEVTVPLMGNQPVEALSVIQRPVDPQTHLSTHVARRGGTPDAGATPLSFGAPWEAQVASWSRHLFELLGCRDVARADWRVDAEGRPWLLEINPLPSLAPDDAFGWVAEYLGTTYAAMIGRILTAARERIAATRAIA